MLFRSMGRILRPISRTALYGASAGIRTGWVAYLTGRYLLDASSWRDVDD